MSIDGTFAPVSIIPSSKSIHQFINRQPFIPVAPHQTIFRLELKTMKAMCLTTAATNTPSTSARMTPTSSTSTDSLKTLRMEIDTLDTTLLSLLHKRFALTKQIGRVKRKEQSGDKEDKEEDVHVGWRENEILNRVIESCKKQSEEDGMNVKEGVEIFRRIFEISKKGQRDVVCIGKVKSAELNSHVQALHPVNKILPQ